MKTEFKTEGNTARFIINRPKARNAIDFDVMDHLESAIDQVYNQSDIRAFILTGHGNHFISGGDLKQFHQIKKAEPAKKMAGRMQKLLEKLEKAPCWTVALINGSVYGGGWETMLACDFRIASSKAVFGFTQGKFYLPPGWGGLTRLVEKVGRSTALLLLAEAAVINSDTALKYGLVDRVFPHENLHDKFDAWINSITHNDRAYISNLKLNSLHYSKHRWESIDKELDPFSKFWEHEKHNERVQKFIDRNQQS